MMILALAIAGCTAYFSVLGLSQLFAGAATAVIIMASVLELGKIVVTTALHTYWKKLGVTLRLYLTSSVVILMVITSAGIYGFLSNAYQKTSNKLEIHEGELNILNLKKENFEKLIASNETITLSKTKRIDQLIDLRNNQENRLDGASLSRQMKNARLDIETANNEIKSLTLNIDELNSKNIILSDSVNKYNVKMLELKVDSDVAGEVGPLKYISSLTGIPMANIVNYMILLIIFVFDPLAISLIIVTNRIFEIEREKKEENDEPLTKVPKFVDDMEVKDLIPNTPTPNLNVEVDKEFPDEQFDDTNDIIPIYEVEEEIVQEVIIEEEIVEEEIVQEVIIEEEIVEEEIVQEEIVQEEIVEEEIVQEEIKKSDKVLYGEIKEVKANRGFSVPVPNPKHNSIQRIGSNKYKNNDDDNKIFFKK